ncbi:MAG TPA: beta-galactosidase family protein [Verrucomicrobiae bacterium]|nr:beta-galactosidase family protein [Verrucomicrobiae bacterium]
MIKYFVFTPVFAAFLIATGLGGIPSAQAKPAHAFAIGTNDFLLDGHRIQIRCGEMHAARVPREYWRDRLRMAKAMGLNTVCAYLFWNQIEPRPGKFDWSGQADAAEFCRIAQEEGLWVILRPGPYSCAEWEEGGLPWWLLKNPNIQVRTTDPAFLEPAKAYLRQVGKELGPLQITHGGPILMVQVENEYGSYGDDTNYMGELRQALRDSGFDVPLFDCDPVADLRKGYRPDIFPVVNFGSDPGKAFRALREILPQGPLMCGEFYPGWFDTWGQPHHLGNMPRYLGDLQYMLLHGESFSIYMVHGGTTFGLWSGADHPFKPDTSSYDYDAPISEAGWPTEKFYKTRELFSKYLSPGETPPDVPPTNAVIAFEPVPAAECAPIFDNLRNAVDDATPHTMEAYDQAEGCIDYRTTLTAGPAATLSIGSVHDFGFVYVDGQKIGVMDRRSTNFVVQLPERTGGETLDILVDAMGRVNFGTGIVDCKGIHGPVKLGGAELTGWKIYNLPLDRRMLAHLKYKDSKVVGTSPAFWRAIVKIKEPGDMFLDMRSWGKGVVWVNGHCLGRYWNIGPTQTMYVPGPWLKHGKNEIVILDLEHKVGTTFYLGPDFVHGRGLFREGPMAVVATGSEGVEVPVISSLDHPILDELHPEKDFAQNQIHAVIR